MSTEVKENQSPITRSGLTIVVGKPPVWDEAHKHFKLDDERTVYTYGDKLYNPGGGLIPDDLDAHEATHADQQIEYAGGPEAWWKRYFEDAAFRQDQEIEAYANQYKFFCAYRKDRNDRSRFLDRLARDMASPMYNAGLSHIEAMQKIRGNTK